MNGSFNSAPTAKMSAYYVGPLVYKVEDGIRYYHFTFHLYDTHAIIYGELAALLGRTATVSENGGKRTIHISPLHQDAELVRQNVIALIENKLGRTGYVERYKPPASGTWRTPRIGDYTDWFCYG